MKELHFLLFILYVLFPEVGAAKTLTVRIPESLTTLDWNGQVLPGEGQIINQLCEGLFRYSGFNQPLEPAIAEKVIKSSDRTEYIFTLKKGAKWSDGKPIQAQDFVDSWIRLISPQTSSLYSSYLNDVVNALEFHQEKISDPDKVGVKALNENTLMVKLRTPISEWEKNTVFWPLFPIRKDMVLKFGENFWKPGVLVSSGPFVLDSYVVGKELVLKRNPYYTFKPRSNVTELRMKIVSDQEQAIQLYEKGEFNFLSWNHGPVIEEMIKRPDAHLIPIQRIQMVSLNSKKFPMSNHLLRQAIFKAIDLSPLFLKASKHYELSDSFIPPPHSGSKIHLLYADANEAKELLKKSGAYLGGKTHLTLLTYPDAFSIQVATLISNQLKDRLGINLDISSQQYMTTRYLGDFDLVYHSWTPKVRTHYETLSVFTSDSTHDLRLNHPEFDSLILRAKSAKNEKESEQYLVEAQKLLSQKESEVAPLFFENEVYLQRNPIPGLYFDQMGMFVVKDVQLP